MKPYNFKFIDRSMPISVQGFRRAARSRLPKMAWAYVDGGADDLISLHESTEAFQRYRLRQRILTGVAKPVMATTIAGTPVAMPLGLAATGMAGLSHWSGDVAATRAAERAGTRAVLSTASSYSLEEVAAATQENHWFQLYPFGDRERVGSLMDRAQVAGYTAMFVTVDVPVVGNREGERLTGMGVPMRLTPARCLDIALHPRWLADFMRHKRFVPVHYLQPNPKGESAIGTATANANAKRTTAAAAEAVATQARYMQGDLNWEDLAWMRDRWKGKLYVKGVMDADDAERSVDRIGAEGVVVSSHGGRQLDRVPGTLNALPPIVERIGNRAEVYLDGGVRRGADVITALCLGARGVFIGRPYLYGLAVGGEAGVQAVLNIFQEELQRALILMGCPDIAQLDRSWLVP